jgi:hypothetical protein
MSVLWERTSRAFDEYAPAMQEEIFGQILPILEVSGLDSRRISLARLPHPHA